MTAPWIDAVLVASYGPMVTTFATLFSAIGLIVVGVLGVAGAGWIVYDAWNTREAWDVSPEAAADGP